MAPIIDLLWLGRGTELPNWPLGRVLYVDPEPTALASFLDESLADSQADAWLIWDSMLPAPRSDRVIEVYAGPGDIWHAGLLLGQRGLPGIIDYIVPTWTLNRDPAPLAEATSWRVSLRACLVRTSVLRWERPRPDFDSLEGAALEWGHRCIVHGALPRHCPALLPSDITTEQSKVTLADEFRFAKARFSPRWVTWAALRAAAAGYAPPEEIADAWLQARWLPSEVEPTGYSPPVLEHSASIQVVTVLIPTLDRPRHLRTLLSQLRAQTVAPNEIIVVDQAKDSARDHALREDFADLPLTVIELGTPGQCSSRNAGIVESRGDAVLFLDDDDEVAPDLLARHLAHVARTGANVSSGVAREPTSGPLPIEFTRARASDVFPTNNTLARREVLERSGLFDLAFEQGARADGDLGMRAYLSGAVMRLDPKIEVLHHHAPRGGLRVHGSRVATYAKSRRVIAHCNIPEVTELYRALRYFSERQVSESIIQAALGTLRAHGAPWRQLLKAAYGVFFLPSTAHTLIGRLRTARAMLERYPQIPTLPPRAP